MAADIDNDSTDDVFYKFDALGRRVARTASSATMVYFQSGQQTIADYTAGTTASSPTHTYVYASYIDEPVMRASSGGSVKHYFHRNQQYSITALTDASGTIIERYAYTAYGTPTITDASGTQRTTTAVGNRYTYTGREWDETLALYHYRARMYDSVAGRFVSKDPISYFGSRWNLYEYTRSMPLSYLDPWGLDGTVATPGAPTGIQPSIPGTKPPLTFPQRPFQPSLPSGVKPLPLPTTKPISPGKPPIGRTWHWVWFEFCKEIGTKIDEEAGISRSCMEYDCQMHLKRINSNLPPDPYPEKCWNEYLAGARQCEDDYPPSVDPDGTSYQNCIDTKEQILRRCTIDAGWPDPG